MNDENPLRVGGIVLCGGESRRMGRCKAWLEWGDRHLLTHVVETVKSTVQPVVVAGRPGQPLPELPSGVVRVDDEVADTGPLAGIAAGFAALEPTCDAAFVTSCDHPLITPAWIVRLIEMLSESPAAVPSDGGRLHPCTAVYRLSTVTVLNDLLAVGEFRAQQFAQACGARVVSADELNAVDPRGEALVNLNDAADYERLRPKMPSS